MPINAHPDYLAAEKEYLLAVTLEDKIEKLKKMISLCPGHKGAENLRAGLRSRLKKFKEQIEKNKSLSKSRSSRIGIKKEDMQAVILGKTKSGKSSLMNLLTNARAEVSPSEHASFTTKFPVIGMMNHQGVSIQLIEVPAPDSEYYDRGIVNSADSVILLITKLEEIKELESLLGKSSGKKIIVYNKVDLLGENEKRRLEANLKSKKYNAVLISLLTGEGISELKEKIFQSFSKIRVFTKEPGKEKSNRPIILLPNSKVKDVAEKILKGFSARVKETKIWGPSSKFPGQKVGLTHILKDMDVVEFKTS